MREVGIKCLSVKDDKPEGTLPRKGDRWSGNWGVTRSSHQEGGLLWDLRMRKGRKRRRRNVSLRRGTAEANTLSNTLAFCVFPKAEGEARKVGWGKTVEPALLCHWACDSLLRRKGGSDLCFSFCFFVVFFFKERVLWCESREWDKLEREL